MGNEEAGVAVAVGVVKYFSYSKLNDFSQCEMRYAYRSVLGYKPKQQGRGLSLGTLLHRLIDAWWRDGSELELTITEIVSNFTAEYRDRVDPTVLISVVDDATWLADRYFRHYAKDRGRFKVLASELELRVPLPKPPGDYHGHPWPDYGLVMIIDQVVREPDLGALVLVERKTMSNWRDERLLEMDPQISTYIYGLRQPQIERALGFGGPVAFGMFDAIRTYRWTAKKEERPTYESFRRILVDRSDAEGRQFALDTYRMCLAADQAEHRGWFLRNVSNSADLGCRNCDFLAPCLEGMRGSVESEQAVLAESYTTREEREKV